MRRDKSNYMIQSVAHALDVIEQFGGGQEELGVTELSKRLKLHKNNVFRLLATLESRGYIEQNKATENYRLGIRCLQLGQRYVQQMGLLQQARPIMAKLTSDTGETSIVAVYRNQGMVTVANVETDAPVRIASRIGDILPLHCTAAGKAHLAFAAAADSSPSLPEGLKKYTEKTLTDRSRLEKEIEQIAKRGFALDLGEFSADVHSVAAPIRDYTRTVVGVLSLSGPAYRLASDIIERRVAPAVVKSAAELSHRLGFQS